jgi:hypothetical protein
MEDHHRLTTGRIAAPRHRRATPTAAKMTGGGTLMGANDSRAPKKTRRVRQSSNPSSTAVNRSNSASFSKSTSRVHFPSNTAGRVTDGIYREAAIGRPPDVKLPQRTAPCLR